MLLLIATGVVKTSLLKGIAWLSGVPWWLCFWKVRHEEPQTHCSSCPRGRVWGSGTSLLSPCHPSRHETLGVWRSSPAKSRCHFFSAATPSPQALRRVGAPTPLRGRRVLLLPPRISLRKEMLKPGPSFSIFKFLSADLHTLPVCSFSLASLQENFKATFCLRMIINSVEAPHNTVSVSFRWTVLFYS